MLTLDACWSLAAGAKSAEVLMRRDGSRSLGRGVVQFATEEAAAAALESLQGIELGGRTLRLKFGKDRVTE